MKRLMMSLALTVGLLGFASCSNKAPDVANLGQSRAPLTAQALREGLNPSCGSCHAAGTSKPFFASDAAFQALVLADPNYVTPGKPDESEFYRLLTGKGTHAYKQMPPSGPNYGQLAVKGTAKLPLADIRAFFTALTAEAVAPPNDYADETASTVSRLSARQVRNALYVQLGLSTSETDIQEKANLLPIRDYDHDPVFLNRNHGDQDDIYQGARWKALGGEHTILSVRRNRELSGSFFAVTLQVAQTWCGLSVAKTSSPLFKYATAKSTSAANPAEVQKNIGYLYTRMLGVPESPAETGKLYALFQNYEKKNSEAGWTAVCSVLIRHPLWISY
jgi:mono/diheme cytochrome c family protein